MSIIGRKLWKCQKHEQILEHNRLKPLNQVVVNQTSSYKMIRLASWNPTYPNKSYHHELAVSSHLIIRGLDCLELKNNIKAAQLASYIAVYCKIENIKNETLNI